MAGQKEVCVMAMAGMIVSQDWGAAGRNSGQR